MNDVTYESSYDFVNEPPLTDAYGYDTTEGRVYTVTGGDWDTSASRAMPCSAICWWKRRR